MSEESIAQRPTFTRVCQQDHVKALVKEAKRVGYTIEKNSYSYKVYDPTKEGALVFRAVLMGRNVWGITYSRLYWQEPDPIMPATPINFSRHITAKPEPV
jgi:hypothetical protein